MVPDFDGCLIALPSRRRAEGGEKASYHKVEEPPYVCEKMAYTAYRVALPLLAWSGKAVGWFDEPGGATQLQTDAPAKRLVDDHVIEPLPPEPDASPCKP